MTRHRFDLLTAIAVSLVVGSSARSVWDQTAKSPIDRFHQIYYNDPDNTWESTTWLGVRTEKVPLDTWMMQEIIYETKPDVLLETGTFKGGSALYGASLFDLIGKGRVITVDIQHQPNLPKHPRITYLLGSSTSPEIVSQIHNLVKPGETVMVALDSDHHFAHVQRELEIYNRFVTPGQYLIVEDTNIGGHPVYPDFGDPGPFAALAPFLKQHPEFVQDRSRERLKVTFNPGGWLKRVRN